MTTATALRFQRANLCSRPWEWRSRPYAPTRAPPPIASEQGNLGIEPPSEDDIRVIEERHLGHLMSNIIGVGMRCKHGYPQAFAFDPIDRAPWAFGSTGQRKSKLESGLFRLSCPLLVKAIDEWEAEGAVKAINEEVISGADASGENCGDEDRGSSMAAMLEEAHAGHAEARMAIIGDRLPNLLESAAEVDDAQLNTVNMILKSGIAGQTRTKTDIKCVHAQLGDHLCRSASNGVAAELLRRLEEERKIDVKGDCECCNQCDLSVPVSVAKTKWWYEPNKNKWKLRKQARRAKKLRSQRQGTGQNDGGDADQLPFDELELRDADLPDRAGGLP